LSESEPLAWVLDLDGVLWRGPEVIPGSVEAVLRLLGAGVDVTFCTNNSSATVEANESALSGLGIPAEGRVVTSAAAVATLVRPHERVLVAGGAGLRESLASVGAPEATQIVIRPFDPGTIKDIEKAIIASDLGLNPQNDGRIIRINIPPLTTETRRKLVTRIKELTEEAKISLRNVRRDGNKAAETEEKDKLMSEDELKDVKEQVQELTKKFEGLAADMAKSRETEVMDN